MSGDLRGKEEPPCCDARAPRLAVVIPSFRATETIIDVLARIGPEVVSIYVIDDGCPDETGRHVLDSVADPRVTVLHNGRNLGVGGAVKQGYRRALAEGAEIIVKIDADGQMDPVHVPTLIAPLLRGEADYSKGNRLAPCDSMPPGTPRGSLGSMPIARRLANHLLSVIHGAATGYWRVADPANGYTAIRSDVLRRMELQALADCYFFETDMLFGLNRIDARIADVPLPACYRSEVSGVRLRQVGPRFLAFILRRSLERLMFSRSSPPESEPLRQRHGC